VWPPHQGKPVWPLFFCTATASDLVFPSGFCPSNIELRLVLMARGEISRQSYMYVHAPTHSYIVNNSNSGTVAGVSTRVALQMRLIAPSHVVVAHSVQMFALLETATADAT
jgi:hypothetical protein